MTEFQPPMCRCGHATGDHQHAGRGLNVQAGYCRECDCKMFVERQPVDPAGMIVRARFTNQAGQRALTQAACHFAERDRAIRAALNAPGDRPTRAAVARELGLSSQRVAQIARNTR